MKGYQKAAQAQNSCLLPGRPVKVDVVCFTKTVDNVLCPSLPLTNTSAGLPPPPTKSQCGTKAPFSWDFFFFGRATRHKQAGNFFDQNNSPFSTPRVICIIKQSRFRVTPRNCRSQKTEATTLSTLQKLSSCCRHNYDMTSDTMIKVGRGGAGNYHSAPVNVCPPD